MLDFEISEKQKRVNKTKSELHVNLEKFKILVSWVDFASLKCKYENYNEKRVEKCRLIHGKKMRNLDIPSFNSVDPDKVVFNFSKRILSPIEKELLSLGLDFGLTCKKPKFVNHCLSFERLCNTLKTYTLRTGTNYSWTNIISTASSLAHEVFNDFDKYKSTFPPFDKRKLDFINGLKNDRRICITRPDKGRGIVVLDKLDHVNKVERLLEDPSKFKLVDIDPFSYILKCEDKLNSFKRSERLSF
ncbi:uncharacterized protein [Procambarus clarkii]|uniref:uncharacterized protein n=1 Tax=Procambarus clarkii TaxID=6728 RepID=UPI0037441D3F